MVPKGAASEYYFYIFLWAENRVKPQENGAFFDVFNGIGTAVKRGLTHLPGVTITQSPVYIYIALEIEPTR